LDNFLSSSELFLLFKGRVQYFLMQVVMNKVFY